MANRLSGEKSPYLLQHAENPVDWYPWTDDAFKKAGEEDKPVFVSIGYATCHWCHVMEKESFENEEVAEVLNRHFVSVKVDREERPDIDSIYMTVCQALTGHGGWPLSIFMTPDRKPFYAGTYFPRSGRMGMPGFVDVLLQISNLWKTDRKRVMKVSEEITGAVRSRRTDGSEAVLDAGILEKAYRRFRQTFDGKWGGFGTAPKFPTPHHLTFLLRWHRRSADPEALSMVEKTLDAMRDGGIFDQVGFGFHRYSVDERWLVPHFEKMLYDQAMLAMAYIEAYQATGNDRFAQVAREIFEYVLRDMTDVDGGFYSAEDADSEGEEGRFYVWKPEEVKEILGEKLGDLFCRYYDISPAGNFEHYTNIPHITRSMTVFADMMGMTVEGVEQALEEARRKLFAARERRVHPFKDDKILTSWNGLMIAALSKGYKALRDPSLLQAALRAADFLLNTMRLDSGRLLRRYRHGEVAHAGYADDYAFAVWGLLELYESTFEVKYLENAVRLQQHMLNHFWDEKEGGFYFTAEDSENLIVREKEIYDGAVPASNSVAALNLMRLGRMTGNVIWEERADRLLKAFSGHVAEHPTAYTQFLNAVDFSMGPNREIVISGNPGHDEARAMVELLHRAFAPNSVLMFRRHDEAGERLDALCSYVKTLKPVDDRPTVYVCENYSCRRPVSDVESLRDVITGEVSYGKQ